jgi:hypothetical protein
MTAFAVTSARADFTAALNCARRVRRSSNAGQLLSSRNAPKAAGRGASVTRAVAEGEFRGPAVSVYAAHIGQGSKLTAPPLPSTLRWSPPGAHYHTLLQVTDAEA